MAAVSNGDSIHWWKCTSPLSYSSIANFYCCVIQRKEGLLIKEPKIICKKIVILIYINSNTMTS